MDDGFSINPLNDVNHRDAMAPSTTRSSDDSVTVNIDVERADSIDGATPLPFSEASPGTINRRRGADTAKIHACGGLITALNSSTPNIPRLLIVNVPPWNSSGFNLLSRARVAKSRISLEIWVIRFWSVLGIIGVIKPDGVATATDISTVGNYEVNQSHRRE
jgi:hypothetical protein